VITSHSSRILSVTPATRDQPRFLARETVAAFEVANPALRGIGDVMQDMGLWVVTNENSDENKCSRYAPTKVHLGDGTSGANASKLFAEEIY